MIFGKRWRESFSGLELDASLSERYLSAIALEKIAAPSLIPAGSSAIEFLQTSLSLAPRLSSSSLSRSPALTHSDRTLSVRGVSVSSSGYMSAPEVIELAH